MKKRFLKNLNLILFTVLVLLICNLSNFTLVSELWNTELEFVNQLISNPMSCIHLTLFWEHVILAVELVWLVIGLLVSLLRVIFVRERVVKAESVNSHHEVTSNPHGFTRIYRK